MPLTYDSEANPFRFDIKTGRGSQLLLHCILAVSYRHIYRDNGSCAYESKSHKRQAFQMLKRHEDRLSADANALDAVLLLMTLSVSTRHEISYHT